MINDTQMLPEEMRALRKGMAMTQVNFALELGMSRKSIVEMEGGKAPIETRTAIALRRLARQIRLVEDTFWVERTPRGEYAVARKTVREHPHAQAMFYLKSNLILYGLFARRDHAYRWAAALRIANNPRNTRKLQLERAAEVRLRGPK